MVVGTDISELLMKNKKEFPYEIIYHNNNNINNTNNIGLKLSSISGRNSVQSIDNGMDNDGDDDILNNNYKIEEKSSERNSEDRDNNNKNKILNEEEITEKFRNYLIYGSVNEALGITPLI